MTNFEKYEDKLKEFFCERIAIDKDYKIALCCDIHCKGCIFDIPAVGCHGVKRKWLDEEYVEPQVDWTKVAVDTPILVRGYPNDVWERRYFAKYENGEVYAFTDGRTSWSSKGNQTLVWKYAKLAEQGDKHGQAK